MSTKTIAVVGVNGNQGGSVTSLFSSLLGWKVRGLTRDPSKPSAAHWKEKGVELVQAELDDVESLKKAFSGANVIFGTTDFWQHTKDPAAQEEAKKRGITVNDVAYEREVQQGKNIIDAAAATVSTLDRFVLCTLNEAKKWSKGKITFNLHFDAKWAAVEYLKSTYSELWGKAGLLQLGVFATNWKSGQMVPKKQEDGTYKMGLPMSGDAKFPMVDPNADTGYFVHALISLPPQTNLMGCGSRLSWNEFCALWSKHNNVKAVYEPTDGKLLEQYMGSVGKELAEMFAYMDDPGYDGGDPSVVYPWEAKGKFGVDVKYTTMEEYVAAQDWSSAL